MHHDARDVGIGLSCGGVTVLPHLRMKPTLFEEDSCCQG